MSSTSYKWIFLVLLAINLLNTGYCKPATSDNEESEGEEDYPNDNEPDNEELNDEAKPPPKITSTELSLSVQPGDNVWLPCDVVAEDVYAILWRYDNNILYTEGIKFTNNDRIHKFDNNTLKIQDVKPEDSGKYSCQLSSTPIIEIVHKLNVISPPEIVKFLPNVSEGKAKTITKNETLTLVCEVRGYPTPVVTWTRGGGKHFPSGRDKLEGTVITFENVNRRYSGVYQCHADNKHGTVTKSVHIVVEYPPEIEIEEETVTTTLGHQPEITCTVHAEPKPQVMWYSNGHSLANRNDRYSITKINNKHTLQIARMNETDFGSYTCFAKNDYGSSSKQVVLSGSPSRPRVKIEVSEDGKSPLVQWSVVSYSQVSEYEIKYRKVEDESWTHHKSTGTNLVEEESNVYEGREILKDLPSSEYEVQVKTKNSYGWSQWSEVKTFSGDFLEDQALYAIAEAAAGGVDNLRPTIVFVLLTCCSIASLLF